MYINRNSWHYNLVSDFGYRLPRSLCSYFWLLMLAIGLRTVVTACVALVALAGIVAFVSPFVTYGLPWLLDLPLADCTFHSFVYTFGTAAHWPWFHDGPFWLEALCFLPSWMVWGVASYSGFRHWERKTEVGIRFAERRRQKRASRLGVEPEPPTGFWGVVFGYFIAVKSRVCPTIEYRD